MSAFLGPHLASVQAKRSRPKRLQRFVEMCQRSLFVADNFLDDEFFRLALDRKITKHIDATFPEPSPTYFSQR